MAKGVNSCERKGGTPKAYRHRIDVVFFGVVLSLAVGCVPPQQGGRNQKAHPKKGKGLTKFAKSSDTFLSDSTQGTGKAWSHDAAPISHLF